MSVAPPGMSQQLWDDIIEAMSRPLEPECPKCHEERKGYACIFPRVPCPHGEDSVILES